MTTVNLNWVGVPDTNPASPPSGFTNLGAGVSRVVSQTWEGTSASVNALWGCNTVPSVDNFTTSVVIANITSNGRGLAVYNASGNGFMFLIRTGDIRVFALASYALSGTALATYTLTVNNSDTISVAVTQSTGTYAVSRNGTLVNTYVNTLYTSGLRAGLLSRAGAISSFSLQFTPAQTLVISTPLVPNTSRTDTCTGFADGAATISFSGVSIPVTIASGSFTYTVPMLADGVVWPRLPATGQTITLTQGVLVATTTANINLPSGYNRLRDGPNNVANFAGLIGDDPTYLQYHFVAADNPLTTDKTGYHVTSRNYRLYQNSGITTDTYLEDGVTLALPRTDTLYIQGLDGTISSHNVTINAAGDIVSVGGLTVTGLSASGLSVSGLTVTGL